MWRIFDWPRTILPVPVFLKRLAAPLWVFSLGMVVLLEFLSLQHHPVYGSGAFPQSAVLDSPVSGAPPGVSTVRWRTPSILWRLRAGLVLIDAVKHVASGRASGASARLQAGGE